MRTLLITSAAFVASLLATPAAALEPFRASYEAFNGGKPLGTATMQVVANEAAQWRVDLDIKGTRGLMGLAGANAQQSTVFDTQGAAYRPLSQATVRRALFTQKKTTGVYDWASHNARWTGDVKKTRKAPVPLQDGDMSGLLINLAVIRDAQPGKTLSYRFVDDGRVRNHQYVVAQELESVAIGDMSYDAMRVSRVHGGTEETVIWVVDGVPTPIRLLQRKDGEDTYDLRLVEYTGA